MPTYKIVRFFANSKTRDQVLKTGLTRDEAEAHAASDESSSATCSEEKRYNLRTKGDWFEGFTAE